MATGIIRTCLLYFLLIFAIRIMGKRQIGDLQPGELVITILISEVASVPLQDLSQPVLNSVIVVFTLIFLEISVSVLTMKFHTLRRFFYGNSAIVIKDGVIDQRALKKLRVTGPDLIEVLRNHDIFDLSDVSFAILETNGQLSVLLKPEEQPITRSDLIEKEESASCANVVISDGKVIKKAIKELGKDTSDINDILNAEKISVKNIFLMLCDDNLNYKIIRKDQL